MNKRAKKSESGITLIALVVTIVVLLILAGASIAMLMGENGIVTKSKDSKIETQIAEVKERAKTDILGQKTENNGQNINKQQLKNILENYFDDVPNVDDLEKNLSTLELTTKVEYGSHNIKISEIYNGTLGESKNVYDPNTLIIGKAINVDKYGHKVKEYQKTTEDYTSGIWRLFYQDDICTYLITDTYVKNYNPNDCIGTMKKEDGSFMYSSMADLSLIGHKLNPMLSNLISEANDVVAKSFNMRATAWLNDTSDFRNVG